MAVHGLQGGNAAFSALFAATPAQKVSAKQDAPQSFEQLVKDNMTTEKTEAPKQVYKGMKKDTGKPVMEETVEAEQITMETVKKVFESAKESEAVVETEELLTDELLPEELENALEGIMALLTNVKQTVMEALQLSEEEFQTTLDEIGITMQDLLDKDMLQQLYLRANGADVADFITSEDLLNGFVNLADMVEQLVQNAELTLEMQELLAEGNAEQLMAELTEQTALQQAVQPETAEYVTHAEQPVVAQEAKTEVTAKNTETEAPEQTTEAKDTVKVEVVKVAGEDAESGAELSRSALEEDVPQTAQQTKEQTLSESFLEQLSMSVQVAGTDTSISEEGLTQAIPVREIVEQIVEQIKVVIQPEQTNMELQLNPEHLGRVHLTITEKEGMMTAQFAAETHAAKEAIESQLFQLRETLQDQGIKVERIEVTVADFSFNQNGQAEQSTSEGDAQKRRAFVFDTEETTEKTTMQFTAPEYLEQGTSSVEYSV